MKHLTRGHIHYRLAKDFGYPMEGKNMLERCRKNQLKRYATSRGSSVLYVDLTDIRPGSLIKVETVTGEIYLVETAGVPGTHGLCANLANVLFLCVSQCQIKHQMLRIGEPILFYANGLDRTTKNLKNIQLLMT